MEGKKKYLTIGILAGLLGALVLSILIVTIVQKPQQGKSTEQGETMPQENPRRPQDYDQPLFNESLAIEAGKSQSYRVRIEISDKTHNVIEGRMEEKSNHGVNFLILDTKILCSPTSWFHSTPTGNIDSNSFFIAKIQFPP